MRKVRVLLAGAVMASALVAGSAAPASASVDCYGQPVNPCVLICQIGLGNKYTKPYFAFCYVW